MYDPQTIQLIVMVVSLVFSVTLIVAFIVGLVLLAKIRSQAAGINKRLDELLARVSPGPANTGGSGMSL